jgi:hypothetical protein
MRSLGPAIWSILNSYQATLGLRKPFCFKLFYAVSYFEIRFVASNKSNETLI